MASDAQPFTPALLASLLAGDIYVNLHTADNPGGEIRGQIAVSAGDGLVASFSGLQENPPLPAVSGTGSGVFRLTGTTLEYDITVDGLTTPITAVHIHNEAIGANGGVAHNLTTSFAGGNTATGSVTLSGAEVEQLLLGNLYVNVHTMMHGGGEVRGQILLGSGIGLSAIMTNAQETPDVAGTGAGVASATMVSGGVVHHATFDGLTGAFTQAHIHNGAIGDTGGILTPVTFTNGSSASALPIVDADDRQRILDGGVYYNIHSDTALGGEIRGQVIRVTR